MLVGSIGLVASVPITTALAAAVLGPRDGLHGHDHGDGGLDQGWGEGIDAPDTGADGDDDGDGPARHAAPGGRRARRRRERAESEARSQSDDLSPSEESW